VTATAKKMGLRPSEEEEEAASAAASAAEVASSTAKAACGGRPTAKARLAAVKCLLMSMLLEVLLAERWEEILARRQGVGPEDGLEDLSRVLDCNLCAGLIALIACIVQLVIKSGEVYGLSILPGNSAK